MAAAKKPPVKKPVKKPTPKPTYKDSEYLAQVNALNRALNSYKSGMNAQKTRLGTDYSVNTRDLGEQKTRDLSDIENDFAARGVVRSGVYGSRVGDYNKEYNQQVEGLTRSRDRTMQDIGTGYRNFNDEQAQLREQARLTAIKRRASKLKK